MNHRTVQNCDNDYKAIIAMIQQQKEPGVPQLISTGDLEWFRYYWDDSPDQFKDSIVWEDSSGAMVAVLFPAEEEADYIVHPFSYSLFAELVAVHARRCQSLDIDEIIFSALTGSQESKALAELGFEMIDDDDLVLYSLEKRDFKPTVPMVPGFSYRSIEKKDVASRTACHRMAFESERMTDEKYSALIQAPTYDPSWDFLCVDDKSGRVVSSILGWYDRVNCSLHLEPMACVPDFQGRGLTRSLLSIMLEKCFRNGKSSTVYTSTDNEAMKTLLGKLGYKQVAHKQTWKRKIV
jgi:predicted N-acetyltransferase YhbS